MREAFTLDCSATVNPYGDGDSAARSQKPSQGHCKTSCVVAKAFLRPRRFRMSEGVFIIAEAGVNHNGSLDFARELVQIAADAGADAIKFQTFKAETIACRYAVKAEYQIARSDRLESQYEMLKKLELSDAAHFGLAEQCKALKIEFLSTPFDLESLQFLVKEIHVPRIKLSSGDLTNAPLLLAAAKTGRPVILSTGMSTLREIQTALTILAFGYIGTTENPSIDAFRQAYDASAGQKALQEKVILLHCTTEYPAPFAEVNLRAMDTMRNKFGLRVGYSDHTAGISVSVAAAALGGVLIEKHFTLDRNLPGPDHQASLEPDELKLMVRSIREVESALGSGEKRPAISELKNQPVARKSLVAARPIRIGEVFTHDNLTVKRAGDGISPVHYWEVLGKIADRDYKLDEKVRF